MQASANSGGILYDALSMKSYNHADTHCFGENVQPIMYTRQIFPVSPFIPEYSEQTDVPIVIGATAFDTKNIITYFPVFVQGLWFGNRMKSLYLTQISVNNLGL